jgi:ribulose-bisphosphate carboxylase large chain
MEKNKYLKLSGERFSVVYSLFGDENFSKAKMKEIIVEQTIEYPAEIVTSEFINDFIIGHVEDFKKCNDDHYQTEISYVIEASGYTIPQLLNVIYGNFSLKPGVKVEKINLPNTLLEYFKGPRFGREGIRKLVGAEKRPLLSSAIKPMGLSLEELSKMAYDYAYGGIDIIKDDHGLSDLPFCPFKERVPRFADAIQRANQKTGSNSLYLPCISTKFEKIKEYAVFAKKSGASGLLIIPGLIGFDAMRSLADDDEISLPIMAHPAFIGSYVIGKNFGISKYAFFGQIARLAGADSSIFTNFGGRFSFSKQDCKDIVDGCNDPMGHIKPIFPTAGGGITFQLLPEILKVYNRDVVLLMGGGLHTESSDLIANCRKFRDMVEKI